MASMNWATAMSACLHHHGSGFYRRERGPATDFRTASTVAPAGLADALVALLGRLPVDLQRSVVEIGAGTGALLSALAERLPPAVALIGVEQRPRPAGLATRVEWRSAPPSGIRGLLFALEWLDTVPVDVVVDDRVVLVDRAGVERSGPPPSSADQTWLARWWADGHRREIGHRRDDAWGAAVGHVDRGIALAVDYGHLAADRPAAGSLVGYRAGRVVAAVPDGDRDLTAAIAWDAVLHAVLERFPALAGRHTALVDQRTALLELGVRADLPARPDGAASTDYATALQRVSRTRLLLDPAGLGGFGWLLHAIGVDSSLLPLPCPRPHR